MQYFQVLLQQVEAEAVEMMAESNQEMLVDLAEVDRDTKLILLLQELEIHLQYHHHKEILAEMEMAEQELLILAEAAAELASLDPPEKIPHQRQVEIVVVVEMAYQTILQAQLHFMVVAVVDFL